jgi:hypothetical protein
MAEEVPAGTIQDVLDWVGDDPTRAQAALDAERAGANRSTLIDKLAAIAAAPQEVAVTETETPPEAEAEAEELAPKPPTEVLITPTDPGVVVQAVAVRDVEVEVPDGADLTPDPDEEEAEPLDAEQVEYLQVVGATNGVVVALNGVGYALGPQSALALKLALDKAVVGLNF